MGDVYLSDLFAEGDLQKAIDDGYVRTQTHPTLPYVIFNYTELAQFARHWTPVTRQCRGLIVNVSSREVLARPFPKVHNYNEPDAPKIALDEPIVATDKVDGSLGISYPIGDGEYAIATRGSFASDQATHATEVWRSRYRDRTSIPDGVTALWEILFPSNRIVIDYGSTDDIILLGGICVASGDFISADDLSEMMSWFGPIAQTFPFKTFGEMLAAPSRENREGFVVRSIPTGATVKFKYEDYVALHKLIFGMNERVVWEHLGEGRPLQELIEPLPDEFHAWLMRVADRLYAEEAQAVTAVEHAYDELLASLPQNWTRKDYALAAMRYDVLWPYLFNLLDGKDPRPGIWKTLRPSGAVTMSSTEESA